MTKIGHPRGLKRVAPSGTTTATLLRSMADIPLNSSKNKFVQRRRGEVTLIDPRLQEDCLGSSVHNLVQFLSLVGGSRWWVGDRHRPGAAIRIGGTGPPDLRRELPALVREEPARPDRSD